MFLVPFFMFFPTVYAKLDFEDIIFLSPKHQNEAGHVT